VLWSTVERRQIRQVELKRDKNDFVPFPKVLRFSADSRFLIAAGDDGSVLLYPTADGAVVRPVTSRSKKIFLLDAAAHGARRQRSQKSSVNQLSPTAHNRGERS
jgi:hypothetical protein